MEKTKTMTNDKTLAKHAMIPGVINAVLNGIIEWFTFRMQDQIMITSDSISSNELSIFGKALQIALMMSIILTTITYLTLRSKPRPAFFPRIPLLTLKHTFFVFGIGTSIAILWQRFVGTIFVGPVFATVIVMLIAGVVSWLISWMTMRDLT
jgi:hypothetical protein